MKRVLVAGGDGNLGSSIVKELQAQGQVVRVMSRKPEPESFGESVDWAQADIVTGDGVKTALQNVHTIVNCISSPVQNTYETDILATQRFLAMAKEVGVKHVLHISIIGIDRIMLPYYQYKLGAELVVIESGLPYTIARIAQFHSFVDYLLSPLRDVDTDVVKIPINVKFQSIHTSEVAHHLAPYIINGEAMGRLPDFGGPEILRLEDMVQAWLDAQKLTKKIEPATELENDLPVLNRFGVEGYNTNPNNLIHGMTWDDYLRQTYG